MLWLCCVSAAALTAAEGGCSISSQILLQLPAICTSASSLHLAPILPGSCPYIHSFVPQSIHPHVHLNTLHSSQYHLLISRYVRSMEVSQPLHPVAPHTSIHPSNWKLISSHSILLQFSIRSLLICHPLVHFSWSFPSINRLSFVQLQNMHPSLHKAITSFVNYSPIIHLPVQSSNVHPSMPACIHIFFHHCTHPSI